MLRLLVRIVVLLVALAVLAAAGMYLHLRRSLPALEGEIAVAGLGARVEILRDAFGIPHIFAASIEDAQFALGFVHAQDRLWQMEMNRRIGSGRLAELLGPRALEADRFLRTLGVRRAAEANLERYDEETTRPAGKARPNRTRRRKRNTRSVGRTIMGGCHQCRRRYLPRLGANQSWSPNSSANRPQIVQPTQSMIRLHGWAGSAAMSKPTSSANNTPSNAMKGSARSIVAATRSSNWLSVRR